MFKPGHLSPRPAHASLLLCGVLAAASCGTGSETAACGAEGSDASCEQLLDDVDSLDDAPVDIDDGEDPVDDDHQKDPGVDDPDPVDDQDPEPDAADDPEPDAMVEPDPEPDAMTDPEPDDVEDPVDEGPGPIGPAPAISWPPTPSNVEETVTNNLPATGAPGAALCIVKEGAVVWCDGFGLAHVADNEPVTPHTPFLLASISKAVTAVGVLAHAEDGLFGLDDDVTQHLAHDVDLPTGDAITWRQLLTHTGGVKDDWNAMESFYGFPMDPDEQALPPLDLHQAVQAYFDDEGSAYSAANFQTWAPGGGFEYTNMGIALMGAALADVAAAPFPTVMHDAVLAPLGMTRSSYDWTSMNGEVVAMPYGANMQPYGYYAFADTPDGGLRASAYDLARFLAMLTNGGELDGVRVLESAMVDDMTTPQVPALEPSVGLSLFSFEWAGDTWWTHSGAEQGVSTDMMFRESDGLGYVLLLNGDGDETYNANYNIEDVIIPFGESL